MDQPTLWEEELEASGASRKQVIGVYARCSKSLFPLAQEWYVAAMRLPLEILSCGDTCAYRPCAERRTFAFPCPSIRAYLLKGAFLDPS